VYDLVDTDETVRARALDRHKELLAGAAEALHWSNRVWQQAGTPAPAEPHLAAEMDQARADFAWHRRQTIHGPLASYCAPGADIVTRRRCAPYLVLYLRWEAEFPRDFDAPEASMWSRWSTKESVLRRLDRGGVPDPIRSEVAGLILAALRRPYRCKDWRFARLVRHVPGERLSAGLDELLACEDPLVRLRAKFVRTVARHPDRAVSRQSFQRWLASDEDE
jgi:hypothetical protein